MRLEAIVGLGLVLAGVVAAGQLVGGCGRGECAGQVAEMREVFGRIPAEVSDGQVLPIAPVGRGVELPASPGRPLELPRSHAGEVIAGATVQRFDVLRLRGDGRFVLADGETTDDPWRAASDASSARIKAEMLDAPEPPLLLALERDAPVRALLAAAAELRPSRADVRVLVYDADYRAPREDELPATLRARLDERRAALREQIAAGDTTPPPSLSGCAALNVLFAELTGAGQSATRRRWLTEAPTVITERCSCAQVDVPGLVVWTWMYFEPWHPKVRGLPLELRDPAAEAIELPAEARASDLVTALAARSGARLRVVLRP